MRKYVRADYKIFDKVDVWFNKRVDRCFKNQTKPMLKEYELINLKPLVVLPDRLIDSSELVKTFTDDVHYEKITKLGLLYLAKPFFNEVVYHFVEDMPLPTYNLKTHQQTGVIHQKSLVSIYIDIIKKSGWLFILSEAPSSDPIQLPLAFNVNDDGILIPYLDVEKAKKYKVIEEMVYLIHERTKQSWRNQGADIDDMFNRDITMAAGMLIEGKIAILSYLMGKTFTEEFYSVTEQPIRYENKKRQLISYRGKTVWLNALPTTVKFIRDFSDLSETECLGVPKLERRAHQKRGYWCTLKADRFKEHPLYMVHKGCYRRPAWVGPKQIDYEGNTYKIILNTEHEVHE